MYKRKSKTPPKGEKIPKMLAKGERAYSLVDERQRGKRRLRQGEKLNFRCRKVRETRPLYVEAEPELSVSCLIWFPWETKFLFYSLADFFGDVEPPVQPTARALSMHQGRRSLQGGCMSNRQPEHCRCIRDAGVYRHHERARRL
ncbi:hypothetical protein TNCV_771451 [Trichonephila clavipes]|nr:hypothetical protein TNCV_771451 [Trichonephila clavipes]